MKVKFMPNVYAILGDSNTRKSSTVRALTGVSQWQSDWEVARTLPTGNIDVYVQIKALQEDNINEQEFVRKIAEHDQVLIKLGRPPVSDILIPLRISAVNGFHDGAVYLQHFARAGWNIMPIVFVLGAAALPTASLPAGVRAHRISYLTRMPPTMPPANKIASDIRGLWSWL
jgi:hypothetical protein